MFSKAVRDHSNISKPLVSNPSRLNLTTSATSATSSISAGVKRKLDSQHAPSGALGALHSSVYFNENDFDDDDDLDFNESYVPPNPIKGPSVPSFSEPQITQPEPPSLPSQPTNSIPNNIAPTSSIPLPWSSSPPTHLQPPPKRRTLPWTEPPAAPPSKETKHSAPKRSAYPWNKPLSAVKEEQKELRKLNKYKVSDEKKPNQMGQPPLAVAPIFLSEEQKRVVEAIVGEGKSIFFTGSAGTGKSVLMREIIRKLREKYRRENDRVAVTASTGLAACNIEGVTLHSFAGIGLGKEPTPDLVKKVKKNQKARTRWMRTKVLVIDEISMVDGDLFDKLEGIARKIRNNGRPFGGIQLVVTGDFFQLPPVPDRNREAKFAFDADTWNTSIQHTILLTHVFRQKDPVFAGMLNEMRLGKLTPASINAFQSLSRPLDFHDSLDATELFPTRTEVENANSARMNRLSGEVMSFHATDSGTIQDLKKREQLLSNCMAPPIIHLKKGAQVMLIKNMDESLVNGSLGRIVAFMDEGTFDYYSKNETDFQTGSGDAGGDDLARAKKKLKSMAYDPKDGGINTTRKWPVVCFVLPDRTERHLLCQPEAWKIELPNGEIQAQRQQVPLILAWALSIHKAQGQTLQRVKVDLGRVFEKGQAYVALSRATSQAGLQVSRFEPRKVMVHQKVVGFYSNLTNIKHINKPTAQQSVTNNSGDVKYPELPNDDWEADLLQGMSA